MPVSQARTLLSADYAPQQQRGVLVGAQPMWWPTKASGDTLDFSLDLAGELDPDADTLVQATAVVSPSETAGLQLIDLTATGSVVTAWLAGGSPGATYTVGLGVTTLAGRSLTMPVSIQVASPFDEAGAQASPAATSVRLANAVLTTDGTPVTDTAGNTLTSAPITWVASTLVDDRGRTVTTQNSLPVSTL